MIRNKKEYERALKLVESMWDMDLPVGSVDADIFNSVFDDLEAYEEKNYPFE